MSWVTRSRIGICFFGTFLAGGSARGLGTQPLQLHDGDMVGGNTFHSSTDSGRNPGIPRIPAGINRNLTGIDRDYPYLGYILLFYFKQMFLNWGIDQNSIIFTIFY